MTICLIKTLIAKGLSRRPIMAKGVNGGTVPGCSPVAAPGTHRWAAEETVNGQMITDYPVIPTSAH